MPTTQTIPIDLNTRGANPVAFTHQGDTARSFVFEVYNNGEAFALSGYTAKIGAILPADKGYTVIAGNNMTTGSISGNTITATLPATYSQKSGNGILTIILTGSGATIRPINIGFRIQKSADGDDVIAGASDFPAKLDDIAYEAFLEYLGFLNYDITQKATLLGEHAINNNGSIINTGQYRLYYYSVDDFIVSTVKVYGNTASYKAIGFYSGVPADSTYIDGVRLDAGVSVETNGLVFDLNEIDIPTGTKYIAFVNMHSLGDYSATGFEKSAIGDIFQELLRLDVIDSEISGLQSETAYLFDEVGASDAAATYGGYINNTGKFASSATKWISYVFNAEYIDKITSVSAYTNSSTIQNISFFSVPITSRDDMIADNFLSRVDLPGNANNVLTYSDITPPDGCKGIVITHDFGDSPNGMSDLVIRVRQLKYDVKIDKNAAEIEAIKTELRGVDSNVKAIYKNIWNANDFAFVGDELWLAKPVTWYDWDDCEIRRFKIVDGALVQQGARMMTDFGHLNTVDYNADNDCLVFGNGANDFETEGNWFAVVPHPLQLSGTAKLDEVGIKFNVDIGYKVQAVWGDSNLGNNNIVILYANNCTTFAKVLLTKDANGNFDGNYITLETHTNEGSSSEFGSGGGDFWGNDIYIGNGGTHGYAKVSMSDYSLTRIPMPFYLDDGTQLRGSTQGMYIDKEYMWMFINTASGQDTSITNALIQYYR